jgi:hypothetical protein
MPSVAREATGEIYLAYILYMSEASETVRHIGGRQTRLCWSERHSVTPTVSKPTLLP